MKYYSLVASSECLGSNEVHKLLLGNDWSVITLRKNYGDIFDGKDYCLNLNRLSMFTLIIPFLKLYLYVPSGSRLLADGIFPMIVAKLLAFFKRDVSIVMLVHNDYSINNRTRWKFIPNVLFDFLYRMILVRSKIVTTSDAALKALQLLGYHNVTCINNVVVPARVYEDRVNEFPVFWFIGRLVSAKRVCDIIESARQRPEVIFNIVGNGEEFETLVNSAPGNVVFKGFVEEPFQLVSIGDVFMLPSSVEGRSLALLKAASAGMLLIVSDIPENNFISSVNGVYFHRVCDVSGILHAVDTICSLDAVARMQMGLENKSSIDKTLDVRKFKQAYKDAF